MGISMPYHIYTVFFVCELCGDAPIDSAETNGVDFFYENRLPPLSVPRITQFQVKHMSIITEILNGRPHSIEILAFAALIAFRSFLFFRDYRHQYTFLKNWPNLVRPTKAMATYRDGTILKLC